MPGSAGDHGSSDPPSERGTAAPWTDRVHGAGILVGFVGAAVAVSVGRGTGAGWGAALGLAALLGGGLYVWSADEKKSWGDIGAGMFVSVVVAIALMAVQRDTQERARMLERQRETRSDRQNLLMTLALQPSLENISLARQDLRAAFLRGRNLQRSDLGEAKLQRANLAEVRLNDAVAIGAHFDGADLRDAQMRRATFGDAVYVRSRRT
jgi:hypothetical protein